MWWFSKKAKNEKPVLKIGYELSLRYPSPMIDWIREYKLERYWKPYSYKQIKGTMVFPSNTMEDYDDPTFRESIFARFKKENKYYATVCFWPIIDEGYKCQKCGRYYKVDIIVPDDLWLKISPKKSEGGMLCGTCIIEAIEASNKYGSFQLIES